MLCAIHQPNFFPWLGYFDKIRRSEIFVLLDDVQYPKSGSGSGSWVNRVKIDIQNTARWVGCPLKHQHGSYTIRQAQIDETQPWRKKLLRTLEMNYKKAPAYAEAMSVLEPLITFPTDNLAEFNVHAIRSLAGYLGLPSRFVCQSELGVSGHATDLLIAITKEVGADAYLCGGGAAGYQEDAQFSENKVKLVYQNYVPEPYGPPKRFKPGLSIIDFLMYGSDPRKPPSLSHSAEAA